ncbi:DUF3267 domain-containing protein [Thermanaerothrix sp. 4228-RoL]|uniref:DUF3267 domain-containing protein n=1 Tax=Thermanaerothrix solaris TaxID=3058434 RepID=A0ABU3NIE9_9CHLR|nr:DUF3267 domain-containing protein [Thermanaerothrix sp. 4228-RoL]MDT8896636.1 DUF3267 domain-containing protein [Thermanaerothrix sp. 4228-RoL]
MRFHYGSIPENKDFNPEAEGWLSIREPGPIAMQVIAIPVALILLAVWAVCLFSIQQDLPPFQAFRADINTLLILLLIIPVHELLHAFTHPGWGTSSNSIIGLWLSKGLFYAHYEGEMSRNRFLLVFVMPLIVLGVLPTLLIMMRPEWTQSLLWISLFGTILASGDLVCVGIIFFQIPRSAVVRNKGWRTYWKPAQ